MNIVPGYAPRLIAMIAFILASSHLAAASDITDSTTFRLAMGPMSAAQKNQNSGIDTKSDAMPIKPHHRIRHRRMHHHR
jgi:hypothetical protein